MYSGMRSVGCRVVAYAKMIKEAGYAQFSDPDAFFAWGVGKKYFRSYSNAYEETTFGLPLQDYIAMNGGACTLIANVELSDTSTDKANMMSYIRQGYYVILSSTEHTAYVGREVSLQQGEPVLLDSWSNWTTNPATVHTYTGSYDSMSEETFSRYRVYAISGTAGSGNSDTMMPSIQNVKIVERTANGYTVECDVTDNVGVLKVQFPTWESAKTSEGCVWHDGTYVGNSKWRFTYTGATAEGNYTTHIYAWDAAGNVASDNTLAFVYVDRTLPVFESVTVEQKTKVGYTVTCKVSDNVGISKVQFPTWETVKTSDGCTWYDGTHMGNNTWEFTFTGGELGKTYTTDIYAFDTSNNWRCYAGAIELALELDAPQINAIVVNDDLSVDLSFTPVNGAEGYLIYRCTVGGGEWITVGTASTAIFKDIYAKYPGYAFDYSLSAYATKSDGTIFQSDWANSKRIKIPGGVENENENESESDTEGENTVIKDEQNSDCDNLEDEQIEDLHDIVEIEDIILVGMSKKVAAGRMLYLTSCVYPMDATNKNIIWTSSNKKYATVSNSGVVTTNKAGAGKTVTITATAKDGSGAKATYKIKIMKHKVKSVKLKASKKTVKAGKTVKIKSTVKTTGKKVNKTLKWTSSNTEYATVTSKGVVKTKKAGKGKTVTITAMSTDGTNKKAKIKIKIK